MDVERQIERLEERLRAVADPERAAGEKRYLKSELTSWGPRSGRSTAVKEVPASGGNRHDELVALVEALWAGPVFERRMAAVSARASPELPRRRATCR